MKRERAEKLFNLLGEIDDEIIAEADVVGSKSSQIIQMGRKRNVTRLATIAASIAFLAVSVWGFGQFGMQSENDNASNWDADDVAMGEAEAMPDADMEEDELAYDNLDIVDELKFNPDLSEVVLNVDISTDGTMLHGTIINYSDTIISPSHPSLEYFNGEEWHYVPTVGYLEFVDIGWTIFPGDEHEFSLDLTWYIIPEGYPVRLRKTVWPDGEWPDGWNQTYLHHDLVYEFEIKN